MNFKKEKAGNNFCPYCRKATKPESNFCPYCGKPLKESSEFDNTLKLYDTDANQSIEIKNEKINVGRSSFCKLRIADNYISQIHALFHREGSSWFITDKNSKNGTYLNQEKLKPNIKYKLCPGDVVSFAGRKAYVFDKPTDDRPHEYSEEELLGILEEAIERLHTDDDIETVACVIATIMAKVPLLFLTDLDFYEMFGNIDPTKLKIGEEITSVKDVKAKIVTLKVGNEEVVPMFTSPEQASRGPSMNITRMYPKDYLPLVISMNKPFMLNPFGDSTVVTSIKIEFLKNFVLPIMQENLNGKN